MVSSEASKLSAPLEHSQPSSFTNTPPPPYKESNRPPIVVTETTTRTEVITTTTTHFFSLPLWRRRVQPNKAPKPYHDKRPFPATESIDAIGNVANTTGQPKGPLFLEKALPPIPPQGVIDALQPRQSTSSSASSSSNDNKDHQSRPTYRLVEKSPYTRSPPASAQSASALVRAGLSLSLAHVLPSASSSTSEINTIAFVTPPTPGDALGLVPRQGPQRLRASATFSGTSPVDDRRRSRGFAFGSASLLQFTASDGKGNGKRQAEESTEGEPSESARSLIRRSSFWSRNKIPNPSKPTNSFLQSHPQPHIKASSSLLSIPTEAAVDNLSLTSTRNDSRVLSRSLSERALSRSSRISSTSNSSNLFPNNNAEAIRNTSSRSLQLQDTGFDHALQSIPSQHLINTRARAHTNPPLLRRLSMNVLNYVTATTSTSNSPTISPPPSVPHSTRVSLDKPRQKIPKPLATGDSPSRYLERLLVAVSKAEVGGILASSAGTFHVQALRTYLSQFKFAGDPLDIALRKLLMDVGLPKETQQIDRVMEAFAAQYQECNPSLFLSSDHPYILAFSLIMLHTDAFNKSNKRKMSKADYIRNTRLPGLPPEILDCFYDNTVFAPFVFIEDPVDVNGQRGLTSEGSKMGSTIISPSNGSSGSMFLGKTTKLDPYHMITHNLLSSLRVKVQEIIPLDNPFVPEGTAGAWDQGRLQAAFANTHVVEVTSTDFRAKYHHNIPAVGIPPNSFAPNHSSTHEYPPRDVFILKLTKFGSLDRKDDILESGRKASNRRWRPCSVVLTGSQLVFFKDPNWISNIPSTIEDSAEHTSRLPVPFKPDELISVKDMLATLDQSYTKHSYVIRLITSDGRQILIRASNEEEMNDWLAKINYASAFKSAGIRMRTSGMSGRDVQLTGIAAATSHLQDLHLAQSRAVIKGRSIKQDTPTVPTSESHLDGLEPPLSDVTSDGVPVAPEIDGADQLKATFDQVKADLAAGRWSLFDNNSSGDLDMITVIPSKSLPELASCQLSSLPSRSQIIQSKICDFEDRISLAQSQLDTDIRFLHNVATLTPFQKATRDRLTASIPPVAKRVTQLRITITRLKCHRDILSRDLGLEIQDWNWARELALKTAADTIQYRRAKMAPIITTLSSKSLTNTAESSVRHYPTRKSDELYSIRPESSTRESFYSALEFGSDGDSSEEQFSSKPGKQRWFCESPKRGSEDLASSFPFTSSGLRSGEQSRNRSPNVSGDLSTRASAESQGQERFNSISEDIPEEAEEWDKTRAANRVSLVRLPSDMGLSRYFYKHKAALS